MIEAPHPPVNRWRATLRIPGRAPLHLHFHKLSEAIDCARTDAAWYGPSAVSISLEPLHAKG